MKHVAEMLYMICYTLQKSLSAKQAALIYNLTKKKKIKMNIKFSIYYVGLFMIDGILIRKKMEALVIVIIIFQNQGKIHHI